MPGLNASTASHFDSNCRRWYSHNPYQDAADITNRRRPSSQEADKETDISAGWETTPKSAEISTPVCKSRDRGVQPHAPVVLKRRRFPLPPPLRWDHCLILLKAGGTVQQFFRNMMNWHRKVCIALLQHFPEMCCTPCPNPSDTTTLEEWVDDVNTWWAERFRRLDPVTALNTPPVMMIMTPVSIGSQRHFVEHF